ncbi:MAG: hypothetical protein FJW32_11565 [Acidobacteria bacterium]|nr:hypothetical protein [Acidobacteriota bacterium]
MFAAALVVIALAPWADPFDSAFVSRVRRDGASSEIVFRPAPAREWVSFVRGMREEAPAKQQYVQFLKDLYGYNIGALNAAYGIEAGSFTELLTYDFRKLDLTREAVKRDDASFLRVLTEAAVEATKQK